MDREMCSHWGSTRRRQGGHNGATARWRVDFRFRTVATPTRNAVRVNFFIIGGAATKQPIHRPGAGPRTCHLAIIYMIVQFENRSPRKNGR